MLVTRIYYSLFTRTQVVVRPRVLTLEQWCDRRRDAASLCMRFPTFRINGSPSSSVLQRSMSNAEDERDKRCKWHLRRLRDVTQRILVIKVPTFRDNLSVPSWHLRMGPKGCPKTVGTTDTRCNTPRKGDILILPIYIRWQVPKRNVPHISDEQSLTEIKKLAQPCQVQTYSRASAKSVSSVLHVLNLGTK
jgi:hypothetical protein